MFYLSRCETWWQTTFFSSAMFHLWAHSIVCNCCHNSQQQWHYDPTAPIVICGHGLYAHNLGSSITTNYHEPPLSDTNIKTLSSQYIAMFAVVLDLSFTAPHCCDCKTVTACSIESCNPKLIPRGNLTPQRCKLKSFRISFRGERLIFDSFYWTKVRSLSCLVSHSVTQYPL